MNFPRFVVYYFLWHYGRAIKLGFLLWQDLVWFLYNFFSVGILFKTYFSKFHRLGEGYVKGLNIKENLANFVVNSLMRLVGIFLRTFVIIVGLASIILATLFAVAFLVVWIFLPLLLTLAILIGINKISS